MNQTQPLVSERQRNLIIMTEPRRWPAWPFLPLMRRRPGQEEECGVLFDALRVQGLTGYSATVFLINIFLLPPQVDQFLSLPREVYDTAEEVFEAGWRVD